VRVEGVVLTVAELGNIFCIYLHEFSNREVKGVDGVAIQLYCPLQLHRHGKYIGDRFSLHASLEEQCLSLASLGLLQSLPNYC